METLTQLEAATRLAIAALVGLGVGLEREWSGHASGPGARFAGIRTFLLFGIIGGAAGLLAVSGAQVAAAVLVAGGLGFAIAGYVMAMRRPGAENDATTEAAAATVVAIGALAGIGWTALAAGAGSLVLIALSEKERLHWFVKRVGERELRAAAQFAVLALVVLPLLPQGPLWGPLEVRPRALWIAVLIFSGLNFVGYFARRAVGPEKGPGIVGMLGGIVSSTLVTLQFARESREHPARSRGLAAGAVGACTVLFPRVVVLSAAFSPAVAASLAPRFILPVAVGAALTAWFMRRDGQQVSTNPPGDENPLRVFAAIRMALLFQLAITALGFVRERWGEAGLYTTAALLGVTDVDAVTAAMARPGSGIVVADAARAIAVGIMANTLLKLGIAIAIGAPAYRLRAGAGIAALGGAAAIGVWWF